MKAYNRTENRALIINELNDLAYKVNRRFSFVCFGERFSTYDCDVYSRFWSDEDLVMMEHRIYKSVVGRWKSNHKICLRAAHELRYEPDMRQAFYMHKGFPY